MGANVAKYSMDHLGTNVIKTKTCLNNNKPPIWEWDILVHLFLVKLNFG